eukprot:CAMPEP_0116863356 /NCGR_PEP_ID=MMETSP0418-20121206/24175_1 /TAXON_ID=1158023 /ORGANISM="Astrosyne radiata, Strain 13vi08-1A" /LENGTH=68 /DNA_ID=CAMNT_0004498365 /DNA_START=82 /DNA_END=285 /DNA_ORIENTATION=-
MIRSAVSVMRGAINVSESRDTVPAPNFALKPSASIRKSSSGIVYPRLWSIWQTVLRTRKSFAAMASKP